MDINSDGISVSVIVRTKNSEKTIQQCLDYLFKQNQKSIDVIIVDSGSTDQTLELIEQYDCTLLKYPKNEIFNYAKAINIGIEQAKGQYILILSSHSILLDANMMDWMCRFLNNEKRIAAVSFNRHGDWKLTNIEHFDALRWEVIDKDNFRGYGMFNFCALIRKKDWEKLNFNEAIPRCEDQDWVWRQMREEERSSILIHHPRVYYENPYYNFRKDLWDYIIMGRYVYPKYKNIAFILENYKLALRTLTRLKIQRFWYYFRLGNGLLKEKIFPTPDQKIQSIYHSKLN